MRVQGGTNLYGFSIGILMLDTRFPRIPGDMGNAGTFDFPVRYHRVTGASPDRVVRQGQRELLPTFIEGARFLEREGVRAVTTNCGFLAKFQPEMAAAVSIPVFTSSLLLVPLVQRMLPPGRAVGVLTVNAPSLNREHLAGAGISPDTPLVVAGLETEKEFTRVLLDDLLSLDVETARQEHLTVARRMVAQHPEIGAIVLECTNMPPYAKAVARATRRPVHHIISLLHERWQALGPTP
jgi:hypothetical protein